jgi:F-type H+-transporting ATPase subunit b
MMQFDWWTLGLQTINFLIVVWLLSRFLYRPVRRVIEEREAADRKAADEARQKAEEALNARQTYEQKLAELAAEQRDREAQFHKTAEAERAKILNAARKEAAQMVEEARDKMDKEEKRAFESLKDRVIALASDLTRTALAGNMAVDARDIEKVSKHLDELSASGLEDLRADLAEQGTVLFISTPAPLSTELKDQWCDVLKSRLGKDVHITFETKPEILGGVELHFPHAALSFSVADRLGRAAEILKG